MASSITIFPKFRILSSIQTKKITPRIQFITTSSIKMQSQNDKGQGASHATGESKVPGTIQEAAPEGLERNLPEAVHPTGDGNKSQRVSHAKDGGDASIVPQKLQEVLPESVERAVPNAIHDTGDKKA